MQPSSRQFSPVGIGILVEEVSFAAFANRPAQLRSIRRFRVGPDGAGADGARDSACGTSGRRRQILKCRPASLPGAPAWIPARRNPGCPQEPIEWQSNMLPIRAAYRRGDFRQHRSIPEYLRMTVMRLASKGGSLEARFATDYISKRHRRDHRTSTFATSKIRPPSVGLRGGGGGESGGTSREVSCGTQSDAATASGRC